MIQNLTIKFTQDSLVHTIEVPVEDDNLPYNLADAFVEIINKSNANENMVLEQMKYSLQITEE